MTPLNGILGAYQSPPGVYDEMREPGGGLRARWDTFASVAGAMGTDELKRVWVEAQRLLRENGVTYNVYGDPKGLDRPWELDALPLVIDAGEWRMLEAGLIQRARLLNAILTDLYGPQTLLRDKLLPPELVFAHRGFLRPCIGLDVPGGTYLHVTAVELARSPNGQWWVLSDRVQNPSGAGYALENRIVLRRVLPQAFHACRVERLARFFSVMRATLANLAPRGRENPLIVVLTPGPYNETYFEHAYLARYLGYSLVEGEDLTVRDRMVYLKTLGGLRRVDVILRRVDDDFCDPLELRTESMLGVPGLVRAAHAGNVAIANALGTGLVESAGILPFLPGLCERLLDEDLLLPSVATWWCGQERERRYVEENIGSIVVKHAIPFSTGPAYWGEKLSGAEREELIARIREKPHEYVGQEQVQLSTSPVFDGNGLAPRHVILRAHLAASGATYEVMPGGLTRVSAAPDSFVVSMQKGGGSKDTWVLAAPDDTEQAPISGTAPLELSRGERELSSRVADNLFWLGRYIERAEGTVRLLRSVIDRMLDESGPGQRSDLTRLLGVMASRHQFPPELVEISTDDEQKKREAAIAAFILEEGKSGQLRSTLSALSRVASIVRDRISPDGWRILKRLEDEMGRSGATGTGSTGFGTNGDRRIGSLRDLLDRLILVLAAYSGIGMESMTRGQGWRLLDTGRRIERAFDTVGVIRGTLCESIEQEPLLMEGVLEMMDSIMTYRSRYRSGLQLAPVVDLLMTDETNPRSVAFQFAALAEHIANLPHDREAPVLEPLDRIVLANLTNLRLADANALCIEENGHRTALARLLDRMQADLPSLSNEITRQYLSHATPARSLALLRAET